ncbi:hypothetical protein [Streptomyces sp. NPDC058045]|uniref:hypothetical protein n=1 Tax=Streptomyces sp. NPDC058045 TaxID=3346311 RepID=UPI0036E16A48
MRTAQTAARTGVTLAAAALPLLATAPASAANSDQITVSTTGSTVRVTAPGCTDGGNAALLTASQADFAQGRQAELAGTGPSQSASWSDVRKGRYTVAVHCGDGSDGGSRTVSVGTDPTISATSRPRPSPTPTATRTPRVTPTPVPTSSAPALGVQGGYGGSSEDRGPLTFAVGGTMVCAALGGGAWYLHRRRTGQRGVRY